jgi:hypothetical protein
MIKNKAYTLILLLHIIVFSGNAQEKSPATFGKVAAGDFSLPAMSFDSSANAVVIADIGSTSFIGDNRGDFSLLFKRFKRVKILNKNGFAAATVIVPLFVAGTSSEYVEDLKAVTYNLENGKVVETKLDASSVFEDKVNKYTVEKKFTFPAIREGSIIEYTYTHHSPFLFNFQPWLFQGEYPCLWSEYEVAIPELFKYVMLGQGYLPYTINTTNTSRTAFYLRAPVANKGSQMFTYADNIQEHRWVIKNVPALKEEPYTTTVKNYISRIEFQLARLNFPNIEGKDLLGNWASASEILLKKDDFGADLTARNSWMDDELKKVTTGAKGEREKARRIYAYVRDNFTCTFHSGLYTSDPLKKVFMNKSGNEADLNLLLIAMLRHEKIKADPLILSTRSNGFTHEIYPLLNRFNYVISKTVIDSEEFYLDASERWLGFGRLPERCFNGSSQVINADSPATLLMDANSIIDPKRTIVMMGKSEKGMFDGHIQTTPGYFESCDIRDKIAKNGEAEFLKQIQKDNSGDVSISNLEIDSLNNSDQPVTISYDVLVNPSTNPDIIYFNPMLEGRLKENPFKAAVRVYPVEMPYVMDENYILSLDVPEGYAVEEIPKSARVSLNNDEGSFEYLMSREGDNIQFRTRIKLDKANFGPEDYGTLRDFFASVVKKENEQIVFKKKKN